MIAFYNYVNGVEKHKEKKQTSIRNASKKKTNVGWFKTTHRPCGFRKYTYNADHNGFFFIKKTRLIILFNFV